MLLDEKLVALGVEPKVDVLATYINPTLVGGKYFSLHLISLFSNYRHVDPFIISYYLLATDYWCRMGTLIDKPKVSPFF